MVDDGLAVGRNLLESDPCFSLNVQVSVKYSDQMARPIVFMYVKEAYTSLQCRSQ